MKFKRHPVQVSGELQQVRLDHQRSLAERGADANADGGLALARSAARVAGIDAERGNQFAGRYGQIRRGITQRAPPAISTHDRAPERIPPAQQPAGLRDTAGAQGVSNPRTADRGAIDFDRIGDPALEPVFPPSRRNSAASPLRSWPKT